MLKEWIVLISMGSNEKFFKNAQYGYDQEKEKNPANSCYHLTLTKNLDSILYTIIYLAILI
jgi:hypothetical protein